MDCQVWLVASNYGKDSGLTGEEIEVLAKHLQYELETEIKWLLGLREALAANRAAASDETKRRWANMIKRASNG